MHAQIQKIFVQKHTFLCNLHKFFQKFSQKYQISQKFLCSIKFLCTDFYVLLCLQNLKKYNRTKKKRTGNPKVRDPFSIGLFPQVHVCLTLPCPLYYLKSTRFVLPFYNINPFSRTIVSDNNIKAVLLLPLSQ